MLSGSGRRVFLCPRCPDVSHTDCIWSFDRLRSVACSIDCLEYRHSFAEVLMQSSMSSVGGNASRESRRRHCCGEDRWPVHWGSEINRGRGRENFSAAEPLTPLGDSARQNEHSFDQAKAATWLLLSGDTEASEGPDFTGTDRFSLQPFNCVQIQ